MNFKSAPIPVETALDLRVTAVTWESHRRTEGLCEWFGFPLDALLHDGARWTRYPVLAWRTLKLLYTARPEVVFVQNPSLVLAILVVCFRRVFGNYRVVMDAHNEAIRPYTYPYRFIAWIGRRLMRTADMTIVTNSALAADVARWGGRPAVLPDRLPSLAFEPADLPDSPDPVRVMVVASYAADEPIEEIIGAARDLGAGYQFAMTGRPARLPAEVTQSLPSNVRLTGYLSEREYWAEMDKCHIVLDLTLKPDCLVCGAYEALAMRRPMVLSLNSASTELFGGAANFVSAMDCNGIATALETVRERYGDFARRVRNACHDYPHEWTRAAQRIADQISSWQRRNGASRGSQL